MVCTARSYARLENLRRYPDLNNMTEKTISEVLGAPLDVTTRQLRLQELVRRHQNARTLGIDVLNMIGTQTENLLTRIPEPVRDRLDEATEAALHAAMGAAHGSRAVVGETPGWLNRAVTTAMGVAGGVGGLPTALAELPFTTTVLLRAIQDAAIEQGFDPSEETVRFDCVQVFGAAGPLEADDGADLAFLATRMALSGAAMQGLISRVAPRLATVLGQKLAAQAVPVLGAAAGAVTNFVYCRYYQDIAHVHFGLRRLAIEADMNFDDVQNEFIALIQQPNVKRA